LALAGAGFAIVVSLRDMGAPVLARRRARGEGLGAALVGTLRRTRRRVGGQIVHVGVALAIGAIAISSAYQMQSEGVVRPGQALDIGRYHLVLEGTRNVRDPHRQRQIADFSVYDGAEKVGVLSPAMNRY